MDRTSGITKTDITMYSDDELDMRVQNIESLYILQKEYFELLLDVLEATYIYTEKQLEVLKESYNNEEDEQ